MAKHRKKKIQDYDRTYNFLYRYVTYMVKRSYSSILHVGQENIPKDGAVIFAPNHANTLMDALLMLRVNNCPKVFVARADIFKNPILARIFAFLKIMPIMRRRDGFKAVRQNQEIINKSVDVLKDKIPFCIFPEGTHQAKYSMLPLSKGIFKIAFQAYEQMPDVPLYIVPSGLRYGDFFRFRSTVRVQFGEPINVGQFIAEHSEQTPQEQVNTLRELLAERLQSILFFIPNDEYYDATLEVCAATESLEIRQLQCDALHALEAQFQANRNTLNRIEELKVSAPEQASELLSFAEQASKLRKKLGIDINSISVDKPLQSRMPRLLLTLVTLPYALPVSLLASPVILIAQLLCSKFKDLAFANSVRFVLNLVVWPLFVLIYAIIAFLMLPWHCALATILLVLPAPSIAHELWKTFRLTISDIKLLGNKQLSTLYSQIRKKVMKG